MIRFIILLVCVLFLNQLSADDSWKKPGKGPLKVFIMAGQSNMQGHGLSEHIKMAAYDPKTSKDFAPFMDGDNYVVRKIATPTAWVDEEETCWTYPPTDVP